jgi:hypothetical protein
MKLYFPNYNPAPQPVPGSTPADPARPDQPDKKPINLQTDKPTIIEIPLTVPDPGSSGRVHPEGRRRHRHTAQHGADHRRQSGVRQIELSDQGSGDHHRSRRSRRSIQIRRSTTRRILMSKAAPGCCR